MTLPKLTRVEFEKIKSIYADDSNVGASRSLLQSPDLVIECEGEDGQRVPAKDARGDEPLTIYRWKESKIEVHKRDTPDALPLSSVQEVPDEDAPGDAPLKVYRWNDSDSDILELDSPSSASLSAGYTISIVGIEHSHDEKDLSRAAKLAFGLREVPDGQLRKEGRPKGADLSKQLEKVALAVLFWEWEATVTKRTGKRPFQKDFFQWFKRLDAVKKGDELKDVHDVPERDLTDALALARKAARNLHKNPLLVFDTSNR